MTLERSLHHVVPDEIVGAEPVGAEFDPGRRFGRWFLAKLSLHLPEVPHELVAAPGHQGSRGRVGGRCKSPHDGFRAPGRHALASPSLHAPEQERSEPTPEVLGIDAGVRVLRMLGNGSMHDPERDRDARRVGDEPRVELDIEPGHRQVVLEVLRLGIRATEVPHVVLVGHAHDRIDVVGSERTDDIPRREPGAQPAAAFLRGEAVFFAAVFAAVFLPAEGFGFADGVFCFAAATEAFRASMRSTTLAGAA